MKLEDFNNAPIGIVTMHGKETIIGNILREELGAKPFLVPHINTDNLGTFTNEIKRKQSVIDTLLQKCALGKAAMPSCNLFIASEGSFGNHPELFFAQADEEFVLLKDFAEDRMYFGSCLSTETNYDSITSKDTDTLLAFAEKKGFPEHGLLVRVKKNSEQTVWHKDLITWDAFKSIIQEYTQIGLEVQIDTDMRAHRNPTRQKAIASATLELTQKLKSCCPQCQAPYYCITGAIPGLPCKQCTLPTKSILYHLKTCNLCTFQEKIMHPNGKKFEDPMYCDFCNP